MDYPSSTKCHLIAKVVTFIESRPDGLDALNRFLSDDRILFDIDDVSRWTGWTPSWIRKLCQNEKLPHIPGKKLKFVYSDVMSALVKMQKGAGMGRRRRSRRPSSSI